MTEPGFYESVHEAISTAVEMLVPGSFAVWHEVATNPRVLRQEQIAGWLSRNAQIFQEQSLAN